MYERNFESVGELIQSACHSVNEEGWNYFTGRKFNDREFYGCYDLAEAERLAKFGWAEGRKAVDRMKTRIENAIGRRGRTFVCNWDVTGAVVDVGAYVSGVPECMINFEEAETENLGFVDVHFSSAVSGGVDQPEITLQGAAVCALVDALELSGKRVRVVWERSSSASGLGGTPTVTVTVVLKGYDEVVDLDRLAFFMTSACARRPLSWSIYALAPKEVRAEIELTQGSYVSCYPTNNPKYLGADVHVSAMLGGTESAAAKWVIEQLASLGIEISQ